MDEDHHELPVQKRRQLPPHHPHTLGRGRGRQVLQGHGPRPRHRAHLPLRRHRHEHVRDLTLPEQPDSQEHAHLRPNIHRLLPGRVLETVHPSCRRLEDLKASLRSGWTEDAVQQVQGERDIDILPGRGGISPGNDGGALPLVRDQQLPRALPGQVQLLKRADEGPAEERLHRPLQHGGVGLHLKLNKSGENIQADCNREDDLPAGDQLDNREGRNYGADVQGAADEIADKCYPGSRLQSYLEVHGKSDEQEAPAVILAHL